METQNQDPVQSEGSSERNGEEPRPASPSSGGSIATDGFREQLFTRSPRGQSRSNKSSLEHEGGDKSGDSISFDGDLAPGDAEEGRTSPNLRLIQSSTSIPGANKERLYHVDWLRAAAIALVIVVHCLVSAYGALGLTEEEDPDALQKKDGTLRQLLQIGIPMFFYISGVSASRYNCEKNGFLGFLGGKVLRLFVPLLVSIPLFLIPRLYLSQPFEDAPARVGDDVIDGFWEYCVAVFPVLPFKLSWLWFLPMLFAVSLFCYPLMAWSQRRKNQQPFEGKDGLLIAGQVFAFLTLQTLAVYLCPLEDAGLALVLPASFFAMAAFALYFWTQFNMDSPNAGVIALAMKLAGPLASICMNQFKRTDDSQTAYTLALMLLYYCLFFSQGLFDQMHHSLILKPRSQIANSIAAPFIGTGLVLLFALCAPSNYTGTGSLFLYPLYTDHGIQSLYTTGTWLWLFGLMGLAEVALNDKFHEPTYDFVMACSMYGYLSHYLWIALISVYIVTPSGMNFALAVTLEFIGTILMIGVTYIAIEKVSGLCFPPKAKESSLSNGKQGSESIPSEDLNSSKRVDSGNGLSQSMDSANAPIEEERESLLSHKIMSDQQRKSLKDYE